MRGAAIAILLALSPIAITHAAGFVALRVGCDLNEVSAKTCSVLGVNIGPVLSTMSLAVWFISLTVLAGLVALIVLFVIWLVRVFRARRATADSSGAAR